MEYEGGEEGAWRRKHGDGEHMCECKWATRKWQDRGEEEEMQTRRELFTSLLLGLGFLIYKLGAIMLPPEAVWRMKWDDPVRLKILSLQVHTGRASSCPMARSLEVLPKKGTEPVSLTILWMFITVFVRRISLIICQKPDLLFTDTY